MGGAGDKGEEFGLVDGEDVGEAEDLGEAELVDEVGHYLGVVFCFSSLIYDS